jgi:8-oxo-dGTP pyrophosphatase MutT (NUDIX family)
MNGERIIAAGIINSWVPDDENSKKIQEQVLAFLQQYEDALWRRCVPGHLTASTLLLDATGERTLLTLHKKLGKWLQLGGHGDGNGNLVDAALREAVEESGIVGLKIKPQPIDMDIHKIPTIGAEVEHWHFDVRFVAWAPKDAVAALSLESTQLRWFRLDEIAALDCDESLKRLCRKVQKLFDQQVA